MREDVVTPGDLKKAARGNASRICGDLSLLKKILGAFRAGGSMVRLAWCATRWSIRFASCVATKPCTFFLKKVSDLEGSASSTITMMFSLA